MPERYDVMLITKDNRAKFMHISRRRIHEIMDAKRQRFRFLTERGKTVEIADMLVRVEVRLPGGGPRGERN